MKGKPRPKKPKTSSKKPKHPFTHLIMRLTFDPKLNAVFFKDPNFVRDINKYLDEKVTLSEDQREALEDKNSDKIIKEIEKEYCEDDGDLFTPAVHMRWPVNKFP